MADSETDGINPVDEFTDEAQAPSTENMDGCQSDKDITQPYMDKAAPVLSQTSPGPSSLASQTEPVLLPEPLATSLPSTSHVVSDSHLTKPISQGLGAPLTTME